MPLVHTGTGKETQGAGTEHTPLASSREKQKLRAGHGCRDRKHKIAAVGQIKGRPSRRKTHRLAFSSYLG